MGMWTQMLSGGLVSEVHGVHSYEAAADAEGARSPAAGPAAGMTSSERSSATAVARLTLCKCPSTCPAPEWDLLDQRCRKKCHKACDDGNPED